jgi:ribosomal protein S18 acetylase RimI-like enzyme
MRKPMKIQRITNEHADFYVLMGPFLAKRAIAKEIGDGVLADGVIWDDDGKQWFIAMQEDEVAGFATMLPKSKGRYLLCEAYVLPSYRDQGLYTRLIEERLNCCPAGSTVQIIVHSDSVKLYESYGFIVVREHGARWTELTKRIEGKQ